MDKWWEKDPTMTLVGYTILVASAATAATHLFYGKAQVAALVAETEVLETKIAVLADELSNERSTSERYLQWLHSNSASFPALEARIAALEEDLGDCDRPAAQPNHAGSEEEQRYEHKGTLVRVGRSFTDPRTGAVLAVSAIDINKQANITVTLPGQKSERASQVHAGQVWPFKIDGVSYQLILHSLNYIRDTYDVWVLELPPAVD